MHFPDSVLSPVTATIANATMLPVWWWSGRYVRERLTTRELPLLALGSAFAFTIMLFNLPALGGTTAHAVGGTLLAILLGPRSAILGISIALSIQALFFGDGGLWAFGANCLAMAVVMPLVGYAIYRTLLRLLPKSRQWLAVSAGVGAYVGLNAAALLVAILLGIQPLLAHTPDGTPLYFPFGLPITLPAMLGTHLLIAGPFEAIITALVAVAIARNGIPLYGSSKLKATPSQKQQRWLWGSLLGPILLSPLGLLAQGEAWGEWTSEALKTQIQTQTGKTFLPQGLARAEQIAHKGIRGLQDYAGDIGALGYLGSGLLGSGVIVGITLALGRKESGQEKRKPHAQSLIATDTLPDWLLHSSQATNPPLTKTPLPNPYIARNLQAFSDRWAKLATGSSSLPSAYLLYALDPRSKIVGLLFLLGIVGSLRSAVALSGTLLILLILTMASRISLWQPLKRYGFLLCVFGIAISLPALFIATPHSHALLQLSRSPGLVITDSGLALSTTLFVRLLSALWIGWLLNNTTSPNNLLQGFRALGVPRLATTLIAMTYRYLDLMLQTVYEMSLAKRSRTVGIESNRQARKYISMSMTTLFGKTLHNAEEVHQALVSRGFTGDFPSIRPLRWHQTDSLFLVILLASGGMLWLLR